MGSRWLRWSVVSGDTNKESLIRNEWRFFILHLSFRGVWSCFNPFISNQAFTDPLYHNNSPELCQYGGTKFGNSGQIGQFCSMKRHTTDRAEVHSLERIAWLRCFGNILPWHWLFCRALWELLVHSPPSWVVWSLPSLKDLSEWWNGFFHWSQIGDFRWTYIGCFRRTLTRLRIRTVVWRSHGFLFNCLLLLISDTRG